MFVGDVGRHQGIKSILSLKKDVRRAMDTAMITLRGESLVEESARLIRSEAERFRVEAFRSCDYNVKVTVLYWSHIQHTVKCVRCI